jgi:hypothetical protein
LGAGKIREDLHVIGTRQLSELFRTRGDFLVVIGDFLLLKRVIEMIFKICKRFHGSKPKLFSSMRQPKI